MSLEVPTTADIAESLQAAISASINQQIPGLPKSFTNVLSRALAAVFTLLLKYGGFIFLQIFVSSATDEEVDILGQKIKPLTEWGRLVGVGDRVPGTQAELTIDISVTNQTGSLTSGTQLINNNNGVTYLLIGGVVLSSPTVPGTIRASADQSGGGGVGSIGNLENGAEVQFVNPLSNVNQVAIVTGTNVQGADAESEDAYRQRIVDRFQKRPQGGAYADYELWGEEAEGIINVFPYTSVNPGIVDVYSEATPESSGDPDGIPTQAQLQRVLDLINFNQDGLATRRSANSFVRSFPIIRTGFNVTVSGITNVNDLAQVQSDVQAAIEEFFLERSPFIEGLTIPPRTDSISQSALVGLVEDIVTAANGLFSGVTFTLEGSGQILPLYVLAEGEKSKASNVFFN